MLVAIVSLDLKMKNIFVYFLCIITFLTSCEKSNNHNPTNQEDVMSFIELDASDFIINPSDTSIIGIFTKFSFSEGDTVNHNNWDVAFRGTTLIVNGGEKAHNDQPNRIGNAAVYIANGTMSEMNSVETSRFVQENSSGSAILENMMCDD